MTGLETVVLIVVVAWCVRFVGRDLLATARGGGGGGARGPGRSGGGARGYFGRVWTDAWDNASERHDRRVADRRQRRAERHASGEPSRLGRMRQSVGDWWRTAGDSRRAHRDPATGHVTEEWDRPGPTAWERAWGRAQQRHRTRQQERQQRRNNHDRPQTEAEFRRDDQGDDSDPLMQEPEQPAGGDPQTPRPDPPGQQQPGPTRRHQVIDGQVVDDRNHRDPANGAERNQPKGERHMAEATGLASALAHATAMREECEAAASDTESYEASLRNGGVDGPALEAVAQAMEAQQQLASAWANAEQELTNHMAVREAYESNQGAGSREFVTTE